MPGTEQLSENKSAFPVAIVWRGAVLSGLWWGLSEGHVDAWIVGIPVVIAATAASYWLCSVPGWRFRILGGLGFVVFFMLKSLWSGADVARRAVTLDLAPQIIDYRVSLKHEAPLTFFAAVISLLPGTLTTAIDRDILQIHTLDANQPNADQLKRLEARVAAMFGETI